MNRLGQKSEGLICDCQCADVDSERRAICARTRLEPFLGDADAARMSESCFTFFRQI